MDKWKWNYIVYTIIFCALLAMFGGYYLGTFFAPETEIKVSTNVKEKDYSNMNIHDLIIEDVTTKLIELLNKEEMNDTNDSCNIFATDYFADY